MSINRTHTPKANIEISPVAMPADAILTPAQLYPNGYICPVHPDNQFIMQQAATELGFSITFGAARNGSTGIGVYVNDFCQDPKRLLDRFQTLLVFYRPARVLPARVITTKQALGIRLTAKRDRRPDKPCARCGEKPRKAYMSYCANCRHELDRAYRARQREGEYH